MYELPEIRDSVKSKAQDDAGHITFPELENCIKDAISEVNTVKPLLIIKDIDGDGTQDYGLPSEFEKEFSNIDQVEHPAGENPPRYLDRNDNWFIYEDPTKDPELRLRFKLTTPITGEVIRISIKALHVVTETTSTLGNNSFLAVVFKTLNFGMCKLAAKFTGSNESTIDADSVDYGGRGLNFLELGRKWDAEYKRVVGQGDILKAAQSLQETDIVFKHGENMIFHPKLQH